MTGAVSAGGFEPTHLVPADGLGTFQHPGGRDAGPVLDPRLPVRVVEQRGTWARIICENGWSAWVDAGSLEPVEGADGPPADAIWAELHAAMDSMAADLDDFSAGRIDEATCRKRVLAAGLIVHDDDAWIIDLAHHTVHRFDGLQLLTLELPDRS
jgi:hypothetical protein